MQKKNVAAFVLALIGSIFGIIGGLLWAACAEACADIVGSSTGYVAAFVILGIGGAIVALVGGIQAFGFKKGRLVLTIVGLAMQIGHIIVSCVFAEGFSFILNFWTILAVILIGISLIMVIIKKPEPVVANNDVNNANGNDNV